MDAPCVSSARLIRRLSRPYWLSLFAGGYMRLAGPSWNPPQLSPRHARRLPGEVAVRRFQ